VIISRLFPEAIIFLESALIKYGYTDRIPTALQIAVNRYSKTTKYDIDYPVIQPFYIEPKFLKATGTVLIAENNLHNNSQPGRSLL